MKRIKDLSKTKLHDDHVLLEIVAIKKQLIIINPNATDAPEVDYMVVTNKGANVSNIEVGDIVVETSSTRDIPNFIMGPYKIGDKFYGTMNKNSIYVAVDKNNFKKGE